MEHVACRHAYPATKPFSASDCRASSQKKSERFVIINFSESYFYFSTIYTIDGPEINIIAILIKITSDRYIIALTYIASLS